jgi:hypothetical protein
MPLVATVDKRSKYYAGEPLFPHLHEDGMFVATKTKFKADYVRVETLEQLEALVNGGYGARMSNPDIKNAPSFKSNKNIQIVDGKHQLIDVLTKAVSDIELDVDSIAKRRTEQSLLRAYLLNGQKNAACELCGRELPENMLVAAHIKKRSKCRSSEKLDFKNVAALMCKLGCDDLFEKKYVYVVEGKVIGNYKITLTDALKIAIKSIEGNIVSSWEGSEKYYQWHEKQPL